MRERQIYYTKKSKGLYVIEGKRNKKSVLITTLPRDPLKLIEIMEKALFFSSEKLLKIKEKVSRCDYRPTKETKGS